MREEHLALVGGVVKMVVLATDGDAGPDYGAYRLEVVTDRGTLVFAGCHDMVGEVEMRRHHQGMVIAPFCHGDERHLCFYEPCKTPPSTALCGHHSLAWAATDRIGMCQVCRGVEKTIFASTGA